MARHCLIGLLLLAPALSAQERPDPPTITVEATAAVEREPDRAILLVAVESEAASAQAASQANAEAMGRVVAALRQAGLSGPSVRTVSVQLSPVYSTGPDRQAPPRIAGYRAANMVRVTVDSVARAGRVVDAVIGAGANRIASLTFELRDPEQARLAALEAAVGKAMREAAVVAAAAGRKLGPALTISLSSGPVVPLPRPFERAVAMAQVAETPVEAGTIEIAATVHIVFRLDPS